MKIEIKKLREEEAEEKIDINIKVWWTTYRGLIPDEIIAKLQTKTKERIERQKQTIREKNNTYGIYVDGKLVGYSSYGPAKDENYKDSCEIYSCYILEEYQRLHLGRKVVIKILEDFIQEGYKTMITKCLVGNPANKFHEAIGGDFRNHTEIDLLGERFLENVYYHEDIKKSLKLNQEKEEKFHLEEPSLERKEDAIEYMEEFIKYNSETAGDSGLDTGYKNYEKWLEYIESLKKPETCPSNRCLGLEWFLIRESDNKIVGAVNLRWNLNDWMMQYGGHIGYEVRPTERNKGYNKINLYLCLQKAQELGLEKVLLTAYDTNQGSIKTIESLGGILENKVQEEENGTTMGRYWINVDESLEKNYQKYKKYIKEKGKNDHR